MNATLNLHAANIFLQKNTHRRLFGAFIRCCEHPSIVITMSIINYPSLHTSLKQNSEGHQPKRAKIFRPEGIRRFLLEADGNIWLRRQLHFLVNTFNTARTVYFLLRQVIMILGIYGALVDRN